jgi:hypothetical protein
MFEALLIAQISVYVGPERVIIKPDIMPATGIISRTVVQCLQELVIMVENVPI